MFIGALGSPGWALGGPWALGTLGPWGPLGLGDPWALGTLGLGDPWALGPLAGAPIEQGNRRSRESNKLRLRLDSYASIVTRRYTSDR